MEEQKIIGKAEKHSTQDAQWQWQIDTDPWNEPDPAKWTWQNYLPADSDLIEQAFCLNKDTADLKDYEVVFKKMLQVRKDDRYRIRRVRRQEKSRFLIETSPPKPVAVKEQKTMNEAFGTIQHFLNYIINRTPEGVFLCKRLKTLTLSSKNREFQDVMNQVITSIEKAAEARTKICPNKTKDLTVETSKIIDEIKQNSNTLRDFLKVILKVYTMETFICYWLNELLRSESWEEMNVFIPYLVCLVCTFRLSEYTIRYQETQTYVKNFWRMFSKQKLILYRGAVLTKQHLKLYNPDKVRHFSWNGVTSTSRNKEVARNFIKHSLSKVTEPKVGVLFKIETSFASSRDSEGMIDISQDSQYPDEQEIILVPGTVFKLKKVQLIKISLYKITLQVTKEFEENNQPIPLLGTLHNAAVQNDTALIEGLPSYSSLKLLGLLKGDKQIKNLEIKNSIIEEHHLEEIENIRVTTNIAKENINLVNNKILVSSMGLFHYFPLESLKDICGSNELEFTDKAPKDYQRTTTILLKEDVLEKVQDQKQWKAFWNGLKDDCQIQSMNLSMRNLKISEDELRDVSDCIRQLKDLKNLTLKLSKSIWKAIGSLSSLKKLDMEMTLSDNFVDVRNSLVSLKSLRNLSLNFSKFSHLPGKDFNNLKNGIRSLKFLQSLDLSFSSCWKFSDKGINFLQKSLEPLKSLRDLSLEFGHTQISDEGLSHLKSGLIQLTALQCLSLGFDYCKASDAGLNHLKDGFSRLLALQNLSLSFKSCEMISDEGLSYLKSGFTPLLNLRDLSLKFNLCKRISDEGLNSLKSGLKSLESLQNFKLSLSGCEKVSSKGKDRLENELKSLPSFHAAFIL